MRLAEFLESLPVLQGDLIGENLRLLPWESRLLADIENPKYRTVALSVARGNGKSCFMAAVGLWYLLHGSANSDVIVVAASFAQAKDVIGRFVRGWGAGRGLRFLDSANRWECHNDKTGARMLIKSCDPRRLHGLAPALILCDEPAQWPAYMSRPMFEACQTALGKISQSKLCAFSTRPERGTWFDSLLNSKDKSVAVHCYSADKCKHIFRVNAMKAANPSWDYFANLRDQIKVEARIAKRDNGALPAYKSYRLNLPLEANREMIVSLSDWKRLQHKAPRDTVCYVGIDLGSTDSLCAAAVFFPRTGRLEVYAGCGNNPALEVRERRDGAAYPAWYLAGDLWTFSGRVVPVAAFLEKVAAELRAVEVAHIGCDSYRLAELLDGLDELRLDWPSAEVRRGRHKSRAGGAFDIRAFQRLVLNGELSVARGRPMLEQAIANSEIGYDSAGNPKLLKAHQKQRIDVLSSAIIAVGAGQTFEDYDWSKYQITIC